MQRDREGRKEEGDSDRGSEGVREARVGIGGPYISYIVKRTFF